MEKTDNNKQKQENYREQFIRLNKAMSNAFYLEAVFIEYSIMEDRTESILKHMGKWDAYLKKRGRYQVTIDSKVKYIQNAAREKRTLPNKYFGDGMLDEILEWKEKRNKLIHALLKQSLTTAEIALFAAEGKDLAEILRNRATNYRRAVQRQSAKAEKQD